MATNASKVISAAAAAMARQRAKSQTPERRREVAQKAAAVKWARYRAKREAEGKK